MRKLMGLCFLAAFALLGWIACADIWIMRMIQTHAYGQTWMTQRHFQRLQTEMSYEDALKVLGRHGKEIASGSASQAVFTTYAWHNADGSSIILIFKNDLLAEKARDGLD